MSWAHERLSVRAKNRKSVAQRYEGVGYSVVQLDLGELALKCRPSRDNILIASPVTTSEVKGALHSSGKEGEKIDIMHVLQYEIP